MVPVGGGRILGQSHARRGALRGGLRTGLGLSAAGALPALAGCTWPVAGGAGSTPAVYVGLARSRAIAVLDAVTDRLLAQVSLDPLGERGRPWQLLVGPSGGAAMLPLMNVVGGPAVGVVTADALPREAGAADGRHATRSGGGAPPGGALGGGVTTNADRLSRRCFWLHVGTSPRGQGASTGANSGLSASGTAPNAGANSWVTMDVAQGLASDARGHAYVLVGGPDGTDSAYAAVVDLGRGAVLRTLPLSGANEAVLALVAEPAGRLLYAAVWRWDEYGYYSGQGRILTIDSANGALLGQYILPNNTAATDLALAPAPGTAGAPMGVAIAVYAAIATPGPSRSDDENWWAPATRFALAAFDSAQLTPLATWPLDQAPNALAITADGRRAYVLAGPSFGAPWSRRLVSLDLLGGGVVHRWPLPEGCLALAASHVGKLYVADLVGDRLWRVDTLTDTFLGSIPMPGGPLAITARRS